MCDIRELRNLFHRIGGALLIFSALFSVLSGGASLLQQFLVDEFPNSAGVYIVTDLLCSLAYVASFTLPVLFFFMISHKSKVQPLGLSLRLSEKYTTLSTLAIVFLGTSVCLTCSYVNSILFSVPESAYDTLMPSNLDQGYKLILMFISTAIVPAFVEELLFRGVILSNIRPYNENGAILISALLFGLMHQTPFQFFYATAVGVVFGIVCVKTGSIWSGILLHFFNNFFSVIQTYLLEIYDAKTGNLIYGLLMCAVISLGIILGTVFYFACRRERRVELGVFGKVKQGYMGNDCASNAELISAFKSPTIIIFIVLCAMNMVSTALLLEWI